jgi:uncharacterized protein YmfQ (DUF2313 family)
MGIAGRTLRSLFLRTPWPLSDNLGALIDALALSIERLRVFLMDVLAESNPGTADETLRQWYADLGIAYDPTQSKAVLRKLARATYSAVGGQSRQYIESVLQIAYPNVSLEETIIETENMAGVGMAGQMMATDYYSWVPPAAQDGTYPVYYYRVTGTVSTPYDLNGIQNILDRIAPLTHIAVYDVTVLGITDTGMAGLGVAGLAEAGKE